MKKLFLSLAVAGMFAFFACGPSEAEKAAQATADSLKADSIQKAQADSIAAVAEKAQADSIAAAIEKVKADSIAAVEAKKGGKKGK